jgi:hypothetical protein
MAPVKSMERTSSFALACNLLSRYVKQNGAAAGELGLGIRGKPRFREEKLGSLGSEFLFLLKV